MIPDIPLPPFLSACRQRARLADRVKQIDTICIPTANRPASFARAARSYLNNAKSFGRHPELVVVDDSSDPAVRAEYRQLLLQLSREHAVSAFYAGAEEKSTYLEHLTRESSVPRALIEFALLDPCKIGYHPGANRNALLLQTAGRPFFCADDDTLCRPAVDAVKPYSLRLSDAPDPTTIQPYENFESLEQELKFAETDVLGEHERVLGSDIGSLLTKRPDVRVDVRNPGIIRAIHENTLKVAVSWSGIAGDCGYKIPAFLFNLPETTMRHLTRDEASYRRMLASRQIRRSCDRLTVTPAGYCQSTALAFDNRRPLPPFLPVLRGEDMVFGQVLKYCQPDAAIAYQPTTLLHVPQVARGNSGEVLAGIARHRSQTGLIVALLRQAANATCATGPLDVSALAKRAGEILKSEFFEIFSLSNLRSETEQMIQSNFAQLFTHPDAPAFWRRDVATIIRTLNEATGTQDYIYPAELSMSHPPAARAQILKDVIAGYFDLLAAWPALWSAAVRLRERGITPARML